MDLSHIFKAYDVRGLVPDELDADIAYAIGSAFAEFIDTNEVIVGYDCRLSSPSLRDALVAGVTGQGIDVRLIGEVPTDVLYLASGVLGLPGVVITASPTQLAARSSMFSTPLKVERMVSYSRGQTQ